MRYMILVSASTGSEAASLHEAGVPAAMVAMAQYRELLAQAGVLLDGAGLRPSHDGWRIRHADGQRALLDGPSAAREERVIGYTLIQVRTREEAVEWTRRFPAPRGPLVAIELDVRLLHEPEELGANPSIERFHHITPSTSI